MEGINGIAGCVDEIMIRTENLCKSYRQHSHYEVRAIYDINVNISKTVFGISWAIWFRENHLAEYYRYSGQTYCG